MSVPSLPLPAGATPTHDAGGPTRTARSPGLPRAGLSILAAAALAGCGGGGDGGPRNLVVADAAVPEAIDAAQRAALVQARRSLPAAAPASGAVQASSPTAATGRAAGGPGAVAPWRLAVQPGDARVAPGEAASFHVRAEGAGGAFEYQWLRDGEPIEGATASQYSFVTTLDDGGATFSVRVRPRGAGAGHERESAPATLAWRDGAG
jgi:hypothetical protein